MNQIFCTICDGQGKRPMAVYVIEPGRAGYMKLTGETMVCKTCNGSGVSPRAEQLRKELGL